jgi:hypothetical protein
LEQREVHVDVEEVRFHAGEPIGRRDQCLAERGQIVEALIESEVFEPIDADLHAEECAELFVHPRDQAFAMDAQHMSP